MAMPHTTPTITSIALSSTVPYTSKSFFFANGLNPLKTCALNNTEADCSICLEHYTYENPASKVTQCGHIFHTPCMIEWVESGSPTCPMCRAQLYLTPPRTKKANSNHPRRYTSARRANEGSAPSLPDGERDTDTTADGQLTSRSRRPMSSERATGVFFDPDVTLDRASRGEEMQMDNVSRWRMGALGLGNGMGSNWQPLASEAPLDY